VRFDFSIQAGLIGFSAAVIGGLGSMAGAVLGSLAIAGIETLIMALMPNASAYRLAAIFLVVIIVLVFRPAGFFGTVAIEKV
jgi:branched-subunit amino acid ABC-type transport system permease component